jgi:hypothetical protein
MKKYLTLIAFLIFPHAPVFSAQEDKDAVRLSCSAVKDSRNTYNYSTSQMTIRIARDGVVISGSMPWAGKYRTSRSKSTSTQMFIVSAHDPRIFGSVNRNTGRFEINQISAESKGTQTSSRVNSISGFCRLAG